MSTPVAWYNADESSLSFKNHGGGGIPLYTHPIKEQEEPNWKEMYWWMHELNHKHWSELSELKAHPVKELTDEEIREFMAEMPNLIERKDLLMFAKAILRKAQEK